MSRRVATFLHWFFLAMLATNAMYSAWQVFVVLAPEGHIGPLFGAADNVSQELLAGRRLYAIEFWVSFGFLALYMAIASKNWPGHEVRVVVDCEKDDTSLTH